MALPRAAPKLEQALMGLRDPEATVEDLQRFAKDLRLLLGETFTSVSDVVGFASQQRYDRDSGLVYRYHEATGLWVSDARALFPFGKDGALAVGVNAMDGPGPATQSYRLPQAGVFTRWGWKWSNASVAGDLASILSPIIRSAAVPAASTQFAEDLLSLGLTFSAGGLLSLSYSATAPVVVADPLVWVEVAWTKAFDS